jgi:hypothetical protein
MIAIFALLAGGVTQLPSQPEQHDHGASVLVVDQSPFGDTFEQVAPAPIPDPVPDALGSPETDRLRELAEQLTKDAAEIAKRAEELKPALSSSYWETGPAAGCDCDCLDEATMRKIVSDEIVAALASNPRLSSPGNGSTGGTGSNGGNVSAPLPYSASSPPVYSSGSAGGSVSAPTSWATSSTVATAPRLRDRVASRLATPFQNFGGSKVTIHTFANGQACPACDAWLANVAPKLQADGVTVTQISDITSGTAPQIDVCPDPSRCIRINGAASYGQILGYLR